MYMTARAWGVTLDILELKMCHQSFSSLTRCLSLSHSPERLSPYGRPVAVDSSRLTSYWFSDSSKKKAFSPIVLIERSQKAS